MLRKFRGFTLLELMITLAIAAITLSIGVPALQSMMRNNRTATHMNEFTAALNMTRSEAVKRGAAVSIIPTNKDWAQGWTIFVDLDSDGVLDTSEVVLKVRESLEGNPTTTNTVTSITFQGNGSVVGGSKQINYQLDQNDAGTKRRICINPVGRSSISKEHTTCP